MKPSDSNVTRRNFVAAALAGAALFLLKPNRVAAKTLDSLAGPAPDVRRLRFLHLHTYERLETDYWSYGDYVNAQLGAVNRVLRDWRTGDVYPIDPALLDLLHDLSAATGTAEPYHVICGYRSPATNEMLRRTSSGVASSSLHLKGQAIDIRLPDVPIGRLRDVAIAMKRGGVGYYPGSDFVHVDTGRVRTW
jgi:uncharacterized protein YcbK (DUF882 family)